MSPAYQVHSTCHVVHLSSIFRCVEELLSQAAAAQCKARRIRLPYPAGKVPFEKGSFWKQKNIRKPPVEKDYHLQNQHLCKWL